MRIIINAENLVLGRLATFAAKKAMEGNEIDIVNSEKAVITGQRDMVLEKYKHKRERGDALHGPYFPREPELIVRRTIRGMIPYKQKKGKEAYHKVKCYVGIPQEFKDKEFFKLDKAHIKESTMKSIKIGRIASLLGSKHGE